MKKNQSETKDTVIEIKNNLQGNHSREEEAEKHTNDLEHKEANNNHPVQQEDKRIQENKDNVSSLWDNFKKSNICLIVLP